MRSDDVREILAGSLGGVVATVFEYPMDTVKVRLQDGGKHYHGVLDCVRSLIKHEGVLDGFFRGLPAPVIAAAVENAVIFVTYRSFVEEYQRWVYGVCAAPDRERYDAVTMAGAVGGIVVSQVLTPADLIKCKMQIQNTLPKSDRVYRNSLECGMSILHRRGIKGMYRGHVAMMMREAIGCALYFLAFQAVIRGFLREGQPFHEASPLVHFAGGGCAGVAFWTTTYPIDAIKTKQQTMKADYLKLNFRQCCVRLYKTEGVAGFFRGYSVTALRAFPGNAVLIATYEQVNAWWHYFSH